MLHDADPEDTSGARVGAVSPDVWQWLTGAVETYDRLVTTTGLYRARIDR